MLRFVVSVIVIAAMSVRLFAAGDPLVIGLQLIERKGGLAIEAVFRGSPADKAGLKAGDALLQIGDQDARKLKPSVANRLITESDPVVLQVRDRQEKTKVITLKKVPRSSIADAKNRLIASSSLQPLTQLDVGDVVPDLTAQYLDGRQIKLSEWRGWPVLVVFWDSQQIPSMDQVPQLVATYERYHKHGLKIVGVSLNPDKPTLDQFLEAKKIPWPQHFDGQCFDGGVVRQWGVDVVPIIALVGRNGQLMKKDVALHELESVVQEVLSLRP